MKVVLVLAMLLVLCSLPYSNGKENNSAVSCQMGGSCLWVSKNVLNWTDAERECRSSGANLVLVNNEAKDSSVVAFLKNTTNGTASEFYIGLRLHKERFKWSTEVTTFSNYSNWRYLNETSAALAQSNTTYCAYYDTGFKWRLQECDIERRFVCENTSTGSCSNGWSQLGGSCLWVSINARNWTDADRECRSSGANLVLIDNEAKDSLVVAFLKNTTNGTGSEFYIGLRLHKERFKWSTEVTIFSNYSNWRYLNETSAALAQSNTPYCAYYDTGFKWRLQECDIERRFVCENTTGSPSPTSPSKAADSYWICRRSSCRCLKRQGRWRCCSHGYEQTAEDETCKATWCLRDGPWRKTRVNKTTRVHCPAGKQGTYTRRCLVVNDKPVWEAPDESSCSTVPTKHQVPTRSGRAATAQALEDELNSIKGKPINESQSKQYMTKFAGGLGDMLKEGNDTGPKSAPPPELLAQVVQLAEKLGEVLIDGLKKSGTITEIKSIQVNTPSIVLGVSIVPSNSSAGGITSIKFPQDSSKGSIELPASALALAEKSGVTDGLGIVSTFLANVAAGGNAESKQNILNSGLVSSKVQVSHGVLQNLQEPVVISLTNAKVLKNGARSECVYLNLNTSTPTWSSRGCQVNSSNETHTICHCYHLTSFAILLDVHGTYANDDIPGTHKFVLLIVSIVGCSIALLCFLAALIAFHLTGSERRRKKTETMAIHKNLAIAEIFALIFFLVAYRAVEIEGLCFAVALFLHYFLLAVFFWMLVEGLNLHRGMVKVFLTSSRMKCYRVLGWVTPVFIVGVTAAVARTTYVRDDFCWISHQFIWVFAGPVAVILFVNFVILCIAIRVLVRRSRYKVSEMVNNSMSEMEKELRIAFKTTVVLLPLLGLTWCLGFLTAHNTIGNIIIQYLFSIVNSLQGLYFFIAHCLYDEDVIKATNRTSIQFKTMFRRTISSARSGSTSTSKSSTKQVNAYYNAAAAAKSPKLETFIPNSPPDCHVDVMYNTCQDPSLQRMTSESSRSLPGDVRSAGTTDTHVLSGSISPLNHVASDGLQGRWSPIKRPASVFELHENKQVSKVPIPDRDAQIPAFSAPLVRKAIPSQRLATADKNEHFSKKVVHRVNSAQATISDSGHSPQRTRTNSVTRAWGSPRPLSKQRSYESK